MAAVNENEEVATDNVYHEASSKTPLHHQIADNNAMNTLYKDEAKTRSGERATTPGVQHVGSDSYRTTSTLYGHDEDAKEKAMGASSHRATTPGVEMIDNKNTTTTKI